MEHDENKRTIERNRREEGIEWQRSKKNSVDRKSHPYC
jgi:hypothetical protein